MPYLKYLLCLCMCLCICFIFYCVTMSVWQCLCDKVWTNAVSLHTSDVLLPHNICAAASLYMSESDVLLRNNIYAAVSLHMSDVLLSDNFCAAVSLYRHRDICVVLMFYCVTCTETRTYRYIYICRTCSIVLYVCMLYCSIAWQSLCWRTSYSHHIIAKKHVHAYNVARNSICAYIMLQQMHHVAANELHASYDCQKTCVCILCRT